MTKMSQANVSLISNFVNEGFLDSLCLPKYGSTDKNHIDYKSNGIDSLYLQSHLMSLTLLIGRNEHCDFTWQEIEADNVWVTNHMNPILNNKSEIWV